MVSVVGCECVVGHMVGAITNSAMMGDEALPDSLAAVFTYHESVLAVEMTESVCVWGDECVVEEGSADGADSHADGVYATMVFVIDGAAMSVPDNFNYVFVNAMAHSFRSTLAVAGNSLMNGSSE